MDAQQFLAEFGHIANAPGGIGKLREMVLHLAVTGKLVEQDATDKCAEELLARMRQHASVGNQKKRGRAFKKVDSKKFYADGDLPPNWVFAELGEIGDWGAGSTPSRSNSSYYGGTIPWFKSGELKADYITSSEEFVSDLALKECSLRLNIPGDVLIAMYGANIGQTSIVGVKSTTNQAVCACTPHHGLNNRFLLLMLRAMKRYFIGIGAGGAQPNISKEKIVATCIGLPPSEEQSRIVAKVDELMVLCDTLEAQQRARRKLQNSLRQSILQAVASATSPHELQTSWERLEANFGMLFSEPGDLEGFRKFILSLAVRGMLSSFSETPTYDTLGSILAEASVNGVSKGPTLDTSETEILKISAGTSRTDFNVDEDDFKHVALSAEEVRKFQLMPGDLLACRYNGNLHYVGRFSYYRGQAGRIQVNPDKLIRFRITPQHDSRYVCLAMNAEPTRQAIEAMCATTAGNIGLSAGRLKTVAIPLPSLLEQRRIVERVTELMTICDNFEKKLREAKKLAELLASASIAALSGITAEQEDDSMKASQTE